MPRGFLMVVVCLVCGPAVVADTISLKNGDRVTGKIIKAGDKKLLLKTEYAGDLTIALEAVEQIASSDPIYVALADGKTVFGTVMTREGRLVVDTKEGAPVEVERATNERTQFQVFGGGAYNRENFSTGETRNSGEILVGEELNTQLTDRLTFKERLTFFPNLSETGEYRITFDAALGAKLMQNLTWQFVVSDRFLSNPPLDSKKNDLLLSTGLRFTFGRK